MEEKVITYIEAAHIRPHPDNPRKNLGDLSELEDSIKKNGVLQNLTVVPVDGEPGEYMTLIGHRRYAAGTQAGVTKFPCQIVENLTLREQVSIMLEENMQRNDLTVYEQAQGFQMMLDLGETEDSISEKTGFSRTTVRHRLNIAKLDKKVLQEKEGDKSFQLSLGDLYELEKIPDVKDRNEILRKAGNSNNLAQMVRSKVTEIARKRAEEAYIKLCEAAGIKRAPKSAEKERWSDKWETVKEFDLDKEPKKSIGCKGVAKEKLYYIVWWKNFCIIKKTPKREPNEYELWQKKLNKRKKEVRAMQKAMSAEREDFIKLAVEKKFKPGNEKLETIIEQLFNIMVRGSCWICEREMIEFITGKSYIGTDSEEGKKELADYERKRDAISLPYKMMVYAANSVSDKDLMSWQGGYRTDNGAIVMAMDEILAKFGFTYSKEDFYKIAEGTHDLYKNEEEKDVSVGSE